MTLNRHFPKALRVALLAKGDNFVYDSSKDDSSKERCDKKKSSIEYSNIESKIWSGDIE